MNLSLINISGELSVSACMCGTHLELPRLASREFLISSTYILIY